MVEAYWNIGRKIVEEEQQGRDRASYGKEIIKTISAELTAEFGKGFQKEMLGTLGYFFLFFLNKRFGRHCLPNCIGRIFNWF